MLKRSVHGDERSQKIRHVSTAALDLPYDCVYNIYLFAEPVDVFVNARLVCRNWNDAIKGTERFWRRLYAYYFDLKEERPDDDDEELWELRFKMRYESYLFLNEERAMTELVKKMSRITEHTHTIKEHDNWKKLKELNELSTFTIAKRNTMVRIRSNFKSILKDLEYSTVLSNMIAKNSFFLQKYTHALDQTCLYENLPEKDMKISLVLYGPTMNEVMVQVRWNVLNQYFEMSYSVRDTYDGNDKANVFLYFIDDHKKQIKLDKKEILHLVEAIFGDECDFPTKYMPTGNIDADTEEEEQIAIPMHYTYLRFFISLFSFHDKRTPFEYEAGEEQTLMNHLHGLCSNVLMGIDRMQTGAIQQREQDEMDLEDPESEDDELDDDDRNFIVPDEQVEQMNRGNRARTVTIDSDEEPNSPIDVEQDRKRFKKNRQSHISIDSDDEEDVVAVMSPLGSDSDEKQESHVILDDEDEEDTRVRRDADSDEDHSGFVDHEADDDDRHDSINFEEEDD